MGSGSSAPYDMIALFNPSQEEMKILKVEFLRLKENGLRDKQIRVLLERMITQIRMENALKEESDCDIPTNVDVKSSLEQSPKSTHSVSSGHHSDELMRNKRFLPKLQLSNLNPEDSRTSTATSTCMVRNIEESLPKLHLSNLSCDSYSPRDSQSPVRSPMRSTEKLFSKPHLQLDTDFQTKSPTQGSMTSRISPEKQRINFHSSYCETARLHPDHSIGRGISMGNETPTTPHYQTPLRSNDGFFRKQERSRQTLERFRNTAEKVIFVNRFTKMNKNDFVVKDSKIKNLFEGSKFYWKISESITLKIELIERFYVREVNDKYDFSIVKIMGRTSRGLRLKNLLLHHEILVRSHREYMMNSLVSPGAIKHQAALLFSLEDYILHNIDVDVSNEWDSVNSMLAMRFLVTSDGLILNSNDFTDEIFAN